MSYEEKQEHTTAEVHHCQMWVGHGEDCGKPAVYRVRRSPKQMHGMFLCEQCCAYYKARPHQFVVIALETDKPPIA